MGRQKSTISDDYEILQDLKIIKMLLGDIYIKIPMNDFWAHVQMDLVEQSVKDMYTLFSEGKIGNKQRNKDV